jgi:predicted phosphoribosyltransferase
MMYFKDRTEAGKLLASRLKKYTGVPGVILAVPRGGVPVAYEVARELDLPLEVILTKKIGHPLNKEYAIGAASLSDYFIIPHENVDESYITREVERIRLKLQSMYHKFMGDKKPENLEGKTVIIIDDGIATGNTLQATVTVLQKAHPRKIVIAVPVSSVSAYNKLAKQADEVISLLIPEEFYGVGAFYENFQQVTDEEVLFYLGKCKNLKKAG